MAVKRCLWAVLALSLSACGRGAAAPPTSVFAIASTAETTPETTPTPSPTRAPTLDVPDTTQIPATTPTPTCVPSDFETDLVPDAKSHHVGGTFRFVATARNISGHDCPARTGLAYAIRGPKPSDEGVLGFNIHGDYWAPDLPPPWAPGQVERSEFEWDAKVKQSSREPLEPGDYLVTFRFGTAAASTTVTVEPASTPSATPSPVP